MDGVDFVVVGAVVGSLLMLAALVDAWMEVQRYRRDVAELELWLARFGIRIVRDEKTGLLVGEKVP